MGRVKCPKKKTTIIRRSRGRTELPDKVAGAFVYSNVICTYGCKFSGRLYRHARAHELQLIAYTSLVPTVFFRKQYFHASYAYSLETECSSSHCARPCYLISISLMRVRRKTFRGYYGTLLHTTYTFVERWIYIYISPALSFHKDSVRYSKRTRVR